MHTVLMVKDHQQSYLPGVDQCNYRNGKPLLVRFKTSWMERVRRCRTSWPKNCDAQNMRFPGRHVICQEKSSNPSDSIVSMRTMDSSICARSYVAGSLLVVKFLIVSSCLFDFTEKYCLVIYDSLQLLKPKPKSGNISAQILLQINCGTIYDWMLN